MGCHYRLWRPFGVLTVSSHSLKCTALSWLAKVGANAGHRLGLGHPSSERGLLEVYSRHLRAAQLSTLEEIFRQIEVAFSQRDGTRSGIIQNHPKEGCRTTEPVQHPQSNNPEAAAKDEQEASSSSSSSPSSEPEASSSEDEAKSGQWTKLAADVSRQPQEILGYRHHASTPGQQGHAPGSDSETRLFQCGIMASSEHTVINQTAFLDTIERLKSADGAGAKGP